MLPAITILGVVLNSAFLYVIFRVEQMRTITNRYLANLAVADILFLVSAIGPKLLQYATSPFQLDDSHLGPFGCVAVYFLIDTAYFSSLCFITLTSLDKFVALCRPLKNRMGHGHVVKRKHPFDNIPFFSFRVYMFRASYEQNHFLCDFYFQNASHKHTYSF